MIQNKFGELVLDEQDLCDLILQGKNVLKLKNLTVTPDIEIESIIQFVDDMSDVSSWHVPTSDTVSVSEYDRANQIKWFMPDEYKTLDIAEHILSLCQTSAQLQRVGEELLLYQEKDLFDLLRYLKYLVDTMKTNGIIWGVGRGSSVASYVLYLLGVHRIDSMYYDLDPREFLR